MLKLTYLFGKGNEEKEYWFCQDAITDKYYKITKTYDAGDTTEVIEEVSVEFLENFAMQHKDEIL